MVSAESVVPPIGILTGTTASGKTALALELAFPSVPFRIEDAGGVTWSLDPDATWKEVAVAFVIYCDMPLPENRLAAEVTRTPNQLMPRVAAPSATIHNARSTCGTSVPKATAMKTYT